jgi:hypothetical protein
MTADELIGQVKFDERGLVPVVTQDVTDNAVLMMAWANAEAIRNTFSSGHATYWSRSRKSLWVRGRPPAISRTWRRSCTTATSTRSCIASASRAPHATRGRGPVSIAAHTGEGEETNER